MRRFCEGIRSDGGIVEGVTRKFRERRGGGVAWKIGGKMRRWRMTLGVTDLGFPVDQALGGESGKRERRVGRGDGELERNSVGLFLECGSGDRGRNEGKLGCRGMRKGREREGG